MSILSAVTPQQLALAVVTEDEKALTAANGIGKKIAQRVILELKDKLAREEALGGTSVKGGAPAMAAVRPTTRPPERSVPVRTIQPAIPSAIGREAATRERMLTIEPGAKKFLFLIAV